MSLSSRHELGPYTLVEQIAVGGMAEIYLAKTRGVAGFEKYCALKVIHPDFATDDGFVQMLIDEAKITVGLNHTNIAQIFELGRCKETYYIAMEYIDGADLFRIMRSLSEKGVIVPVDVAAYLVQEICTGLEYAHTRRDEQGNPSGIIHRDISPQNTLVSYAGEVKIVDFGIAKAAIRTRQTQTGVIKGKYFYMSPEQAWGEKVDQRTDVFSAGVVLHEVLTGQMLYLEEDMNKLLHLARQANIPSPTLRRPDISPQLEQIVMKALTRDREDRWQTAGQFRAALTSFLFSHAPDFTPDRVAKMVRIALDDEDCGTFRKRAQDHDPGEKSWRGTPSALPRDTGYAFDDLTPIDDPDGPGGSLRSGHVDADRTMVSGPPAMPGDATASAETDGSDSRWDDDTWTDDTADLGAKARASARGGAAASGGHRPEVIVAPPATKPAEADDDELTPALTLKPEHPKPEHVVQPGLGEMTDSVLARMEPTFVGYADTATPSPTPRLLERDDAVLAALIDVPAQSPVSRPVAPIASRPSSGEADLADTMRRMAAHPPAKTGAPQGQQSVAAVGSADSADPAAVRKRRRRRWRVALFAFSITTALAGAGFGVWLHILPQLNEATTLEVISVPEGATVELNGKKVEGRTRLILTIADPTKPQRVTVSLPDYEASTTTVRFDNDQRHRQVIASLVPKFGRIQVDSVPPGAHVLLNGRSVGRAPVELDKLPLRDSPELELRLSGYKTVKRRVEWGRQTWQAVKVVLQKKPDSAGKTGAALD